MNTPAFALDPRLEHDTHPVASLTLCDARLMDDLRFRWLILVPRRAGAVEIADLSAEDRTQLWAEVDQCAAALRSTGPCTKLNLGALGNVVPQLHVHVVARMEGDSAWPGPVWGCAGRMAYAQNLLEQRIGALHKALAG
ncbi:MAG TPA: HIT domain-containing protein [Rhodanobacter sp.]|nr:HIT domain-containing protein [Rhodanobacter sp.]